MKLEKNLFLKAGLLLIVVVGICVVMLNKKEEINSDGIKFKESYESLNNTVRESDGATYNNVEIPENNPMKYVSAKEATEIIKNKTGILYIGANWCPWCRNAVEVLIEVAKKENVNTVYYLDLTEYRNVWEIKENKLVKTTEEKEGYYELLEALDEILGENTYELKDSEGKVYDTKEKRIYMPTVISINKGEIKSHHVGTVDLDEEQTKYSKLTEEQKKELESIYQKMFEDVKSNICTSGEYCD